jgi:hypothetical protein
MATTVRVLPDVMGLTDVSGLDIGILVILGMKNKKELC